VCCKERRECRGCGLSVCLGEDWVKREGGGGGGVRGGVGYFPLIFGFYFLSPLSSTQYIGSVDHQGTQEAVGIIDPPRPFQQHPNHRVFGLASVVVERVGELDAVWGGVGMGWREQEGER
jgi:hypothetical protein